jgi:hypothetical protein
MGTHLTRLNVSNLFLVAFCMFGITESARLQVKVGHNPSPPHPAAALEVESTQKGFLPPRLSSAQRDSISNPPEGLRIFNTDTKCENFFNGSAWFELCGVCTPGPPHSPSHVSGNLVGCSGDTTHVFTVAPALHASSYLWQLPSGWSLLQGQGTNTVNVSVGQPGNNGDVSVTAVNGCGQSAALLVAVSVQVSSLSAPQAGPALAASDAITWNWQPVNGATHYRYNSINDTTGASEIYSTQLNQTGLVTCSSHSLYVWAENACGISTPLNLSEQTLCQQVFSYTGSPQTFTVPAGVTMLTLDAYGAQGHDTIYGGRGGRVSGTLSVIPGQIIHVYVGGYGSGVNGGWNGGESTALGSGCVGSSTGGTGYGGGATDVRVGGTALSNRVLVAGGGGGMGRLGPCGTAPSTFGGAGGGLTGGSGTGSSTAQGGGGGSQSSGGSAASGSFGNATTGSLGNGGQRCPGDWAGGDGGGGYYGGGGGGGSTGCHRGSGGGGSSFVGGINAQLNQQGVNTGHGRLLISW